jgi:amino acid transporter
MKEALSSVDASAAGNWALAHAASTLGKVGAAFIGALIGLAVVALVTLSVSAATLVVIVRRRTWPRGHAKWAWALAVPVGFILSILIPGFFVWVSLLVPIAFWIMVGRFPQEPAEKNPDAG